jgi:CDP-diacylglycerol--serine O-phosphatidyltransferase
MQEKEQETNEPPKTAGNSDAAGKQIKFISALPSMVTLMNALCGFGSILCTSFGQGVFREPWRFTKYGVSFFAMAGYMIFLAMIADMLDGWVARLSGSSSRFGGQLDSLSDAISFGVAPAFLVIKMMETYLEPFGVASPPVKLAIRAVHFIAVVYMICAVVRLARFNVENDEDDSSHQGFAGLPSPPAAGVVISLVIFREDFLPKIAARLPELYAALMSITIWALPFAALAAGILMVTRIPYPHAANRVLSGKKRFVSFLVIFFLGLFIIWNIQISMLVLFWGFTIIGVIQALFSRRKKA